MKIVEKEVKTGRVITTERELVGDKMVDVGLYFFFINLSFQSLILQFFVKIENFVRKSYCTEKIQANGLDY